MRNSLLPERLAIGGGPLFVVVEPRYAYSYGPGHDARQTGAISPSFRDMWASSAPCGRTGGFGRESPISARNLTERSSGAVQGPQRISKRGSSRARRWLHFAAMRLTMEEPVNRWYAAKIERDGGIKKKGLTAIMRKLGLALHRIAKDGVDFEPQRLFAGRRRRRRSQRSAGQEDHSLET